jgi:uncharacterized membrane protein HdeD (DUF308 family)
MIRTLINNWWLLLLRGAFALAFAVFIFFFEPLFRSAFLRPVAYTGVAVAFGVLAMVTGIITVFAALTNQTHWRDLSTLLAEGLTITSGGLVIILVPSITIAEVILIIAATALVVGILEIMTGTHVRRHVKDEWFLIAAGLVAVVFSIFLFVDRGQSISTLLDWIALFSAANGLAMVALALRLHALRHSIHELCSLVPSLQNRKRVGSA